MKNEKFKYFNININIMKQEHKCKKCDHKWIGKTNPMCCPKCKRYDWNIEVQQ